MRPYLGLLVASIILLVAAPLFFILSVAGLLFGDASSPTDLGVYAVTIVLLLFGIGSLVLRRAKLAEDAALHV